MSGLDDYPGDMLDSRFTDVDIELLLSGATPDNQELADLAVYVEFIRNATRWTPTESQIALVSAQAAEIARSTTAPQEIPGKGRRSWRFKPQVAVTSAAVLVMLTFAGVAAASNEAAPGDPLYGIDRALERIGIGSGHGEERLEEANTLLAAGKTQQALAHAAQAIDPSGSDGEVVVLEEARAALIRAADLIDDGESPDGSVVRENVSALLILIKENIHDGTGVDKKEFGQRVAALARDISTGRDESRPTGEDDIEEPEKGDTGPPVSVPSGEESPAIGNGNDNSSGSVSPGGSGNSNGNGNGGVGNGGNGNGAVGIGGPPPGSPSETAPGRGKP